MTKTEEMERLRSKKRRQREFCRKCRRGKKPGNHMMKMMVQQMDEWRGLAESGRISQFRRLKRVEDRT
jgi:hypothetical protein